MYPKIQEAMPTKQMYNATVLIVSRIYSFGLRGSKVLVTEPIAIEIHGIRKPATIAPMRPTTKRTLSLYPMKVKNFLTSIISDPGGGPLAESPPYASWSFYSGMFKLSSCLFDFCSLVSV